MRGGIVDQAVAEKARLYIIRRIVPQERGHASPCWIWGMGRECDGYAKIGGFDGRKNIRAHRLSYEAFVGPIGEGLELDHLCCNRPCVNPAHLEPVTGEENRRRATERRTQCVNGHPYTDKSVRIDRNGHRQCLLCQSNSLRQRPPTPPKPRTPPTHCRHGHEYTPENTRHDRRNGARVCRTCKIVQQNRWRGAKASRLKAISGRHQANEQGTAASVAGHNGGGV